MDLTALMDNDIQNAVQNYPYLFKYIQADSTPNELVFVDIVPHDMDV